MKRGGSLSASLLSYQQGSRREVRSAAETWYVNGWNGIPEFLTSIVRSGTWTERAKQEVSVAGYKDGRE